MPQVKVWFQNRRTKHKRQKEEETGIDGETNDSTNRHHDDDDEEDDDIDPDD